MDFDQVADELYGLPPHDFTALRDERAATARARGEAQLSAAIKELRKPTTSAWLANLLVRKRKHAIFQLFELGSRLRAAQEKLAGDQLRELARRRRQLIAALSKEARELGRSTDAPVSNAAVDELQATLEAAVANPAAADALRAGRLTKAVQYAGIGDSAASGSAATDAPTRAGQQQNADERGAWRQHAAAVREAESSAEGARLHRAEVEMTLRSLRQELSATRTSYERARSEAERLKRETDGLEKRLTRTDRELREAEREEEAARRSLSELRSKPGVESTS